MLSVVIITFNESKHIVQCIQSVSSIADEIVVVDSYSDDGTVQLAKDMGATVYQNKFEGYGQQKNWGIARTGGNFVLSLDADEIIDDNLKESIQQFLSSKNHEAAYINRKNHISEKWIRHGGWYPDWKLRLWEKDKVKWNLSKVHEKAIPVGQLNTLKLSGHIIHNSFDSIEDHKRRVEKYANLKAYTLFEKNIYKRSFPKIRTLFRFIKLYFIKRGFLDGKIGYQIAANSAQGELIKAKFLSELSKQRKDAK